MSIAADIQARLEELWESAEQVAPQEGDAYIRRAVRDEISYEVGVAERPILRHDYRVLERAKPKAPEWEAVVASYVEDVKHVREMFVWDKGDECWISKSWWLKADELVDPVPLVEMPSREELADAIVRGETRRRMGLGPASPRGYHEADAVLELLRGER